MIRIKMKKCLLILLSVSLSLFAGGGCGRSDDAVKCGTELASTENTEGMKENCEADNAELIKVAELCLNAYNSLTYGDNGEIVYLEDVLELGEAACGYYARKLLYDLKVEGYNCRIVGTKSYYRNAHHAMVEVEVGEDIYLFDPTNGAYYLNSLEELMANPKLSNEIIIMHTNDVLDSYTCNDFFDGIYYVETIDGLPDYLRRLNDNISEIQIEGEVVGDNDESRMIDEDISTFLQLQANEDEKYIELHLDKEVSIGEIGMLWYSAEELDEIRELVEIQYWSNGKWLNIDRDKYNWRG